MAEVAVVFAADDAYSVPLAVAARSVVDSLSTDQQVRVFVLDMGITSENRTRIARSLHHDRCTVEWIDSLQGSVDHFPNTWTAITRATYARLFIPDVLPDDTTRALYLDCDVVAIRSVSDLLEVDMNGMAAMAVPDLQSPFVASPSGVPRWFESGRAASDLNFNAGVMLLDLEMWRNDRLTDELVKYLTDGRHYFAQDQEALNVVLAQRIGSLDPRWNQQSELFRLECEVALPFSRAEIERLRTDPWIIHYSNRIKPWHYGHSDHPFASEWYASLDRTAYAGWRPRRSRQYVASIAITRLRNGAKRLKLV